MTLTAGEQALNLKLSIWLLERQLFLQVIGEQPAPSSVRCASLCKDTDSVSTGSNEILSLGSST